jgi:CRP-like cAMP-binding protein
MGSEIGLVRNPLVTKLSHLVRLTHNDIRTLGELSSAQESFRAHVDIVAEGEVPRSAFVLMEGMACRYRVLANGRRQILSFIVPGDICDLHVYLLKTMDHSISTIMPTRIAAIARERVVDIMAHHPRIAAALWWSAMQEEAMSREHIVALGRRNGRERVAYLLCELVWRQIAIGRSDGSTIHLPLTQVEIGDMLGLTPVHVNRVLQEFRKNDLIALEHRRLTLLAIGTLQDIAELDQDYLHLRGASKEVERYLDKMERDHTEPEQPQQGGRS